MTKMQRDNHHRHPPESQQYRSTIDTTNRHLTHIDPPDDLALITVVHSEFREWQPIDPDRIAPLFEKIGEVYRRVLEGIVFRFSYFWKKIRMLLMRMKYADHG